MCRVEAAGALRVEKVWKGTIGDQVMMQHATVTAKGIIEQSSCNYNFTTGKRYMVFAVVAPAVLATNESSLVGVHA
jgi:hypothetical protein